MIRIARLGRLYKILRIMRLFRVLKLGKSISGILGKVRSFLKIGAGFSRLMVSLGVFGMICHVVACVWVIVANIE